jgi:hypothetical protein
MSARAVRPRTVSTSASAWPIVSLGLSALSWSWKTIAASRRRAVSAAARSSARSAPPNRMRPAVIGIRPSTARASVLLPLPDSPTMPTDSPAGTRRLIPFSATTPRRPCGRRGVQVAGRVLEDHSDGAATHPAQHRLVGRGQVAPVQLHRAGRDVQVRPRQ